MTARAFEITLINMRQRIVRNVIAHNTVEAIRIGISMMSALDAPCAITCKPMGRIAA